MLPFVADALHLLFFEIYKRGLYYAGTLELSKHVTHYEMHT
jgi:hypothetical protein